MTALKNVAINPLPWVLYRDQLDLRVERLAEAFGAIREAGFDAVHADIPPDLSAADYRAMLAEYGLEPAPGYFAAHFSTREGFQDALEAARRHAAGQAALGLTEVFFADHLSPTRMFKPALGADFDSDRLDLVIEQMAKAAEVITAEGVTPCLHPHVGSWVESEAEVRAVLDAIDAGLLSFGPDTGHLFWAGMDPVAVINEYRDRVRAVHIKDVHRNATERARAAGADYMDAVYAEYVWTEPGHGDVDLDGVLACLPDQFAGWFVIEVDNPDRKSNDESATESAQWVTGRQAKQGVR
jgi:inosose dehydratase